MNNIYISGIKLNISKIPLCIESNNLSNSVIFKYLYDKYFFKLKQNNEIVRKKIVILSVNNQCHYNI